MYKFYEDDAISLWAFPDKSYVMTFRGKDFLCDSLKRLKEIKELLKASMMDLAAVTLSIQEIEKYEKEKKC